MFVGLLQVVVLRKTANTLVISLKKCLNLLFAQFLWNYVNSKIRLSGNEARQVRLHQAVFELRHPHFSGGKNYFITPEDKNNFFAEKRTFHKIFRTTVVYTAPLQVTPEFRKVCFIDSDSLPILISAIS